MFTELTPDQITKKTELRKFVAESLPSLMDKDFFFNLLELPQDVIDSMNEGYVRNVGILKELTDLTQLKADSYAFYTWLKEVE